MQKATLGALALLLALSTPLQAQDAREALLRGYNEVDPVVTEATGSATATLDGDSLTVTGSFMDLRAEALNVAGTPAHIHVGGPGENGPVVIALSPVLPEDSLSGTIDDAFDLTELVYPKGIDADSIKTAFRSGNLYVNVHSEWYPGGEVRGQLLPEGNQAPSAPSAPQPSDATVVIQGSVNNPFTALWAGADDPDADSVVYVWELALDGDFEEEDLLVSVNTGSSTSATLTFGLVNNLLGKAGLAVGDEVTLSHRAYTQDGALRTAGPTSEVTLERGRLSGGFEAELEGYNEVEPVMTPGSGDVGLVITGGTLVVSGSFDDLSGTLRDVEGTPAHLHIAGPGGNGPIAIPLVVTADPDSLGGQLLPGDNTFNLLTFPFLNGFTSDEVGGAITAAGSYVNVHTETFPAGELRGTPLLVNNQPPAPMAHIITPEEDAMLDLTGITEDDSLEVTWTPRMDPEFTPVVYVWQLSTLPTFSETLVNDNTGMETEISVSLTVLDSLLAESGVEPGETVTLYHRANAQDGSARTTGVVQELMVTREPIVAGEPGPTALGFTVESVAPNPVRGAATVRFALGASAEVGVEVFDVLGRRVAEVAPKAFGPGAGRTLELDTRGLAAGTYVARVAADGEAVQSVRFTVVR